MRVALRKLLWLGFLPLVVGASSGGPAPSPPEACPALPSGVPVISDLASGQFEHADGKLALRLSSSTFACGEWSNIVHGGDCLDRWDLSLTLDAKELLPGTYKLAEIGTDFGDLFVKTGPSDGCERSCTSSTKGIGSIRFVDPEATMEIYAVTDSCITGKLTGVKDPHFVDAPDYDGAFFAIPCH